jgi:N-acetylglucosaminyldiphosphoundecaprenol N-acetyl-beta-D-mannosaminyltransferase
MTHLPIKSIPICTDASDVILAMIQSRMQVTDGFLPIVTFNITMFGAHSTTLLQWLKQRAIFTPDGIGISILALLYHTQWIPRYPGIDMVNDILKKTDSVFRVALIGATDEALNGAKKWVESFGHEVVFSANGFQPMSQSQFDTLADLTPQLILVAKGCPLQDQLIYELSHHLKAGVAIGVGGAFDVWSGLVKRAPNIIQLLGLEWFYRLINQPQRSRRLFRSLLWLFRHE